MLFPNTVIRFLGYQENEKNGKTYYSIYFLNEGGGYEKTGFLGDSSILSTLEKNKKYLADFNVRSVDNSRENYFYKRLDCLSIEDYIEE